jgi:hypothetical protein
MTDDRSYPVRVQESYNMNGKSVIAIGTGGYHSVLVTDDGMAFAFGKNDEGQLGDGTTISRSTPVQVLELYGKTITDISAGGFHTLSVTSEGEVYSWGANNYGQLGTGDTYIRHYPTRIYIEDEFVTHVSAGEYFSLALTRDGDVYAWGSNQYGQLGIGNSINQWKPVKITAFNDIFITKIDAGKDHAIALSFEKVVYTWGRNDDGQLGDGTTTDRSWPDLLNFSRDVIDINGGGRHSLLITNDSYAFGFGNNVYGQLGIGSTYNQPSPTQMTDCMIHLCSNNGFCMNNTCYCNFGYAGGMCEIPICFGVRADDPNVCMGRGSCIAPDLCKCIERWGGNNCNSHTCFGLNATDPNVCSGRGICQDVDICICDGEYGGDQCEIPQCFSVLATDMNVCSGKGNCTKLDTCICKDGWRGHDCSVAECFGKGSTDPDVCSGNGQCALGTCLCFEGFYGDECDMFNSPSSSGNLIHVNLCLLISLIILIFSLTLEKYE